MTAKAAAAGLATGLCLAIAALREPAPHPQEPVQRAVASVAGTSVALPRAAAAPAPASRAAIPRHPELVLIGTIASIGPVPAAAGGGWALVCAQRSQLHLLKTGDRLGGELRLDSVSFDGIRLVSDAGDAFVVRTSGAEAGAGAAACGHPALVAMAGRASASRLRPPTPAASPAPAEPATEAEALQQPAPPGIAPGVVESPNATVVAVPPE
jgi:hypothetical protein